MTRRQITGGRKGPMTGQSLAWLRARHDRLLLRREWIAEGVDGVEGMECVKRALKVVRHDIDVLTAQKVAA